MRFSIRTLLIVTALCAVFVWAGTIWQKGQRQRQLVQSLPTAPDSFGRRDVEITYDFQRDGRSEPRFAPMWVVNMLGVDCFADVVELRTTRSPIGPEAKGTALFTKLSKLPDLEEVSLFMAEGTDHDLSLLAGHKKLRALDLPVCYPVTGVGLNGFASQRQLRVLSLTGGRISDEGLAVISKFENLEELDLRTGRYGLSGKWYSRRGLTHLASLSKLKKLNLWGSDLTDAELAEISKMRSLEQLVFWPRKATGKGIMQLKTLTNLRYLETDLSGHGTDIPTGELENVLASLAKIKDAAASRPE